MDSTGSVLGSGVVSDLGSVAADGSVVVSGVTVFADAAAFADEAFEQALVEIKQSTINLNSNNRFIISST